MQRQKITSLLMLIGSMLIFGTIGIFRRYIPLSSGLLACVRGAIGALVLLPLLFIKKPAPLGRKSTAILVLTGCAIGINWVLLFEAYNRTTVATATLCYYMAPTIVILLSPLLFRERLTPKKRICAGVSLVGMVLVSGVTNGGIAFSDLTGVLFGLGAAVLYATVVILNKRMPQGDAYQRTVIQLGAAAVVMVPYLLLTEDFAAITVTPAAFVMVLVVGVVHTGVAYALYFASIKRLNAQTVAVMSYIDPVSALILSAAVLHEPLTLAGGIGAVLIIGAAIVSEIEKKPIQ